jgi:hypothetical protein
MVPSAGMTPNGDRSPLFFGTFSHQTAEELFAGITVPTGSDNCVYRAMTWCIYQIEPKLYDNHR